MDYSFSELLNQARDWINQANSAGWLSSQDLEKVSSIEIGSPSSLFSESTQRPLVVALFGGTGVGKSSLLNRLAGQDIARTGVERPTSREISAYVHESVEIKHLPKDFPIEKINIATHNDDNKKHILWIDMPDFDSTERKNSEIVLSWLPHIDVLLYVVTPERYRDNKGWRLLLAKGEEHAWLFVMNQWDKCTEIQVEDLQKQIAKAGFDDAIVLRTDCANNTPDDFDELEQTIASLSESNTLKQLEQHGTSVRIQELVKRIDECRQVFGSKEDNKKIVADWESRWKSTRQIIIEGLDWPIQQIAGDIVTKGPKQLQTRSTRESGESTTNDSNDQSFLWDSWAQTRMEDAMDNLLIKSDSISIPVKPLKSRLSKLRHDVDKMIVSQLEESVRNALAKPGTRFQRYLLFIFNAASIILPIAALFWVGYRLFYSYYQSSLVGGEYLGVNFAIHSSLLVITSWLMPWFLHRQLKPSPKKTVIRGLRQGLKLGLDHVAADVEQAIDEVCREKLQFIDAGRTLLDQCGIALMSREYAADGMLGRVLKRD